MDVNQYLAHFRADELQTAAATHHLARLQRRPRRRLARLYARLWWASRPRAATWAPVLLDAR